VAVAAAGIPVAIWAADRAERTADGRDPRWIVIDETVGMMVALAFVRGPWVIWPAGFVLFRAFDVAKPYPVGRLERFPGGWGIVLDDLLAGVYANLVLQILLAGHAISTVGPG